jgi:hypothetical protein
LGGDGKKYTGVVLNKQKNVERRREKYGKFLLFVKWKLIWHNIVQFFFLPFYLSGKNIKIYFAGIFTRFLCFIAGIFFMAFEKIGYLQMCVVSFVIGIFHI